MCGSFVSLIIQQPLKIIFVILPTIADSTCMQPPRVQCGKLMGPYQINYLLLMTFCLAWYYSEHLCQSIIIVSFQSQVATWETSWIDTYLLWTTLVIKCFIYHFFHVYCADIHTLCFYQTHTNLRRSNKTWIFYTNKLIQYNYVCYFKIFTSWRCYVNEFQS